MKVFNSFGLIGLIALSFCGSANAQGERAASLERLKTYRFGGDQAVLNSVSQWVNAARGNAENRRGAARDLATILTSDASFDAKQFACRELVLIAGDEQVAALTALLGDEALAHYALLVLARIPGPIVNEALRRELPRAAPRTQIGIMETLGAKGDSESVALLAGKLDNADANIAEAAASALGKIGTSPAVTALLKAYAPSAGERRLAYGRALLESAERLRVAGDATAALAIYEFLDRNAATPQIGAGALRGLAGIGGIKALPRLLDALGKDDSPMQPIAANLLREVAGAGVTARLGERLPQLSPKAQLLLIAALGDRGDSAAVPALAAMARSTDSALKMAALNALGAVGDVSTVPLLLQIAGGAVGESRTAARAGLARLRGTGVDEKLLALWTKAEPATQVEIINTLGQRRAETAVPRLVEAARSPQPEVGAAAIRVLRDMGRAQDLPALLAALPTAQNNRAALANAITEIARRGSDENQRTQAILARLKATSAAPERAELIPILGKVGGPEALKILRAALGDAVPDVRLAALRQLAEWPGDEPMSDLLRVVRATPDEKQRAIALRGYLGMLGMASQRSPEETQAVYREVLPLVKNAAEKRLLLSGLAKLPSLPALQFAMPFLADAEVRGDAEIAVVEIGRGTAGAWREKTRGALEPIAKISADENMRTRATEVLNLIDKFGDFATAWEASPAYEREGATCEQLFDIAFAPEEPAKAKQVAWRLIPMGTMPAQPWLLDLLALWGGEQRVAYLRTAVWSKEAREVVLGLGSDDGAKLWCNGQIVLSNNVQRAVAEGQDKAKLPLKAGWNQLLLKVTQNNQGWGACARFANADGTAATGLLNVIPSGMDAVSTGAP